MRLYASVQFSHSVMSNSLRPHGLQHTRPPCPSPTPRVHPNSCPLSRWCNPTISSSVTPFSSCLQSFPASGSFQMSQFFASGGQSIGVSASTSALPVNIQDWFPLGRTGWISLQSRVSQESSPTPQFKSISSSALNFLYGPPLTSIHDYWKNHSFDYMTFVGKVTSLFFNTMSRFVIAFLPRRQVFFNVMAVVTVCSDFEAQENKISHCFHSFPLFAKKWWDQMPWS